MSKKKNIIKFPTPSNEKIIPIFPKKEEDSIEDIADVNEETPVSETNKEASQSQPASNEENSGASEKKAPLIFRFVNYITTFFDGIPPAVKSSIMRSLFLALLLDVMCIIMICWTGFNWIFILFCLGFTIFTLLCVISMRRRIKNNSYVTFIGVVADCKKIGFGKKLSYFIVKLINSDGKTLNFKYQENPSGLDKGLPVTLYIADTEPIIKTENGPYIEKYISIQYSADTVSDNGDPDENISVSDYLNQ